MLNKRFGFEIASRDCGESRARDGESAIDFERREPSCFWRASPQRFSVKPLECNDSQTRAGEIWRWFTRPLILNERVERRCGKLAAQSSMRRE
jgi:hypothetical protein